MRAFRAIIGSLLVISCTIDKTDFEAEINEVVTEHLEFKEVVGVNHEDYKISVEALNGAFYTGYNKVRVKLTKGDANQSIADSKISFLPIFTDLLGINQVSCPHGDTLIFSSGENRYEGYVVFTEKYGGGWYLVFDFEIGRKTFRVNQSVPVQEQTNKNLNMTSFTGNDGEEYTIALVAPQKPKVAENELIAGIYKYSAGSDSTGFSYTEVRGYTLQLDPRMPEPSMGNHSSPNNKDLSQKDDGLYYGIVNYTMTGNWTLNFILLDETGKIIKGTQVPADFTPGIHGAKSELYIDILF